MRKTILGLSCIAILAAAGCEGLSPEDQRLVGSLTGAALGVATAKALNADDEWVVVAALAGAAVGTIVARNDSKGQCAVANADGTYTIYEC